MPTIPPKVPRDFLLAPVAAEIDLNLQRFRDLRWKSCDSSSTSSSTAPRYGRPARSARRASCRRRCGTSRWTTGSREITDDGARLRLSGGSVTLDLGLSAVILHYIEGDA